MLRGRRRSRSGRAAVRALTGMAVAAGFLLGGLFLATGNLAAPVVAHFVVNAVNLRALSRRYLESPGA